VGMHLVINKSKHGKKIYNSVLLRESYRENGKVKKRTIANLSACSKEEIEAIALALKNKADLKNLINVREDILLEEGLSVGAVWVLYQTAKILGIDKALGDTFSGKLALWQVMARALDQGSRLSAVRLAKAHAFGDVLGLDRGFSEDDLYDNLGWLSDNQERIENLLYRKGKRQIFLYDVTSSYLEGEQNYFGAYGYNRDGKKSKKQIVIGLLCDEEGSPLSVEVFSGNTQDIKTFGSQVRKVALRFGCEQVTFVGDRGMIKSMQIDELPEGFHYITAITKPQIRALIKSGVIQLGLFDKELCEVESEGIRYILKKNPFRAQDICNNRQDKFNRIKEVLERKNDYLREHAKASVSVAADEIAGKIKRLKIDGWLRVCEEERELKLFTDEKALEEISGLDGCYALKTDLPESAASKKTIHDRYKDLALVEQGFRTCKTDFLEVRPVYVRNEKSTRGHVFAVMLAYMIVRHLKEAWRVFDITPEEGLKQLATLSSVEVKVKNRGSILKIPRPREQSQGLLKALNITLPIALPHRSINVDTRRKLVDRRKK
jgi:transposase